MFLEMDVEGAFEIDVCRRMSHPRIGLQTFFDGIHIDSANHGTAADVMDFGQHLAHFHKAAVGIALNVEIDGFHRRFKVAFAGCDEQGHQSGCCCQP